MPSINVTERTVTPKLDQGLLAGLIAGGVVFVWTFLIGALSDAGAASTPAHLAALAVGPSALDSNAFGLNWLIGSIIWFILFAVLGIVFALLWPRLRKSGTWVPAIVYALASYVVLFQLIGRIIQPGLPGQLNNFALITGFFLAGVVFAYRYRRA